MYKTPPNEIKMLTQRSTMTQRRKTGRGLEEWKIGHGGLHQLLEKNAQEVTFLTPLLWLDSCSKYPILLNAPLVQEVGHKHAIQKTERLVSGGRALRGQTFNRF